MCIVCLPPFSPLCRPPRSPVSTEDAILPHMRHALHSELPISIRLMGVRVSAFEGSVSDAKQPTLEAFVRKGPKDGAKDEAQKREEGESEVEEGGKQRTEGEPQAAGTEEDGKAPIEVERRSGELGGGWEDQGGRGNQSGECKEGWSEQGESEERFWDDLEDTWSDGVGNDHEDDGDGTSGRAEAGGVHRPGFERKRGRDGGEEEDRGGKKECVKVAEYCDSEVERGATASVETKCERREIRSISFNCERREIEGDDVNCEKDEWHVCQECGQRVASNKAMEHSDWHFAVR